MTPSLVIFDCDGVLLDSETLSAQAWSEVLAEVGVGIEAALVAERYTGLTDAQLVESVSADQGREMPPDLIARVLDRSLQLFDRELRPIPGMAELLGRLTLPRCVASNSGVTRLGQALRMAGLAPLFDPAAVFSAEQVARPKPAPDLHLHACRTLGAAPGDSLVIEDSPTGVKAARAAGIPVIGFLGAAHLVPGQAESLQEAGAFALAADAGELAGLLGLG